MKKYILFFLVFFLLKNITAQTNIYHPFPDSNAVWCEYYGYYDGFCSREFHYAQFIKGDTIKGEYSYHKLYRTGDEFAVSCGYCNTYLNKFSGLFRQDIANKKVYIYAFYSHTDMLLYDFNLSINDTLPFSFNNDIVNNYVSSIDSILIDNNYRKRFWISVLGSTSIEDSAYVALIEGVGSTFGLYATLVPPFESGGSLNSFSDSVNYNTAAAFCGITIGVQKNTKIQLIQVFPNPVTNELTLIMIDNEPTEITLYDIASRKIIQQKFIKTVSINTEQLEKGIYIYELRKKSGIFEIGKIVKE